MLPWRVSLLPCGAGFLGRSVWHDVYASDSPSFDGCFLVVDGLSDPEPCRL